jgi:hypothetical protein
MCDSKKIKHLTKHYFKIGSHIDCIDEKELKRVINHRLRGTLKTAKTSKFWIQCRYAPFRMNGRNSGDINGA